MSGKETREIGVSLVCGKLEEQGFVVNRYPEEGDLTVAEKTVQVHAVSANRKEGGDCWSINKDEAKARKVANKVPFHVFVKLDGDRIVESFVWDRDSDQDLMQPRGIWGLFPYRKKPKTESEEDLRIFAKWQNERKGKAGWEWMKGRMR